MELRQEKLSGGRKEETQTIKGCKTKKKRGQIIKPRKSLKQTKYKQPKLTRVGNCHSS
jgi:hypothetical protein